MSTTHGLFPRSFKSSICGLISKEVMPSSLKRPGIESRWKHTFGDRVMFLGFYANEETDHLGVADFLINDMNRFKHFKGRELDSHMPTVDAYRRMLGAFTTMQRTRLHRGLSASQIIRLLKEMTHPHNR